MKRVGLVLGVIVPLVLLIFVDFGGNVQASRMAAIATLMSIFWITEAIPLAATALLPLTLFPILGIASSKQVASQYMNSTVFLLIGGFMIALAMQKWNLHKRLALKVLSVCGGSPLSVVVGFIVATAGLSMWISNTATTLMMMPIALAILSRYGQFLSVGQIHRFSVGLLLSIAYSASIGGMLTLVGTAPNLVFAGFYQRVTGESVGFAQWMLMVIPIGLCMLLVLLLIIAFLYLRDLPKNKGLAQLLIDERKQLGKISKPERIVLVVFVFTALLWVARKDLHVGGLLIQGWGNLLPFGAMIDDGTVAVAMATLLFFIPANGSGATILDQNVFSELPWSIVLLFGGGFALAYGFSESGLSAYLAGQLQGLKAVSLPVLITVVTVGMNLLTELTSNTATTQLVMPILLSTAEVIGVSPVWLMLPAVLSASCAFMFPVATPPNAIVFGTGKIKIIEMVRVGLLLNLIAIVIISYFSYWLIPSLFL